MNPMKKNVWITGASSGIGRALALAVARAGGNVLLSARRVDELNAAAAECRRYGGQVEVLPFDLADTDALRGVAAEAAARMGGIDILCNVGGVGMRGTALETDLSVARRIMNVDFWGAVELTRAVMPAMLSRRSGQVVVLTGVLGKFSAPRRSFYAAAKHALHAWGESLREETLGSGVEITFLVPGWVRTGISAQALESDGSPHGRMDAGQERGISPEECAARALKAIIAGVPEQLIGGYECGGVYLHRLWPGLFRKLLRKNGIG
jgi:short-subunit dehydrogenase